MKRTWIAAFALAFVLVAPGTGIAKANPSAGSIITRQVIGAGGAKAAGGSVRIGSTLGQTLIGPVSLPRYHISAGYWSAQYLSAENLPDENSPANQSILFLPVVVKG